jgi:hypothetical protein
MKRESDAVSASLEEQTMGLLRQAYRLRDRARRSMYGLQREFNAAFPDAFLRLRPWSRRRGQPPYSLCWIRIFAGKYRLDPRTLSAVYRRNPWPFRRVAIHSNRELDTLIHRCQLDAHRAQIIDFHHKAQDLNHAAHACTRALDTTRKLLSGRLAAVESYPGEGFFARLIPADLRRLEDRLRRFQRTVSEEIADLRQVAADYARTPWCPQLDLTFVQDLGFPFGRLLWVDRESGLECARLGRRLRRHLNLDSGHRALLTYIERTGSRLGRLLLRRHATFQKMVGLFTSAISTAQPILERIKPRRSREEMAGDWTGRPTTPPWELRSASGDDW